MTSIVTYAHRSRRPPRKRAKAAAIEAPAIVAAASKRDEAEPAAEVKAAPVNNARKSSIATARKPRGESTTHPIYRPTNFSGEPMPPVRLA